MEFLIKFCHVAVIVVVNDHWWYFFTGGCQKSVIVGFSAISLLIIRGGVMGVE
jgi:hypothetical protein